METGDEFDNGNASPVPPHEREWRHPAEVHAANRQRIAAEAAPPPVSRRTTGILAVIGAASAPLHRAIVEEVDRGMIRLAGADLRD